MNRHLLTTAAVLIGLNTGLMKAESYYPAVKSSLQQFPAGSIDRIPARIRSLSETLSDETFERITIDQPPAIEFESFVPVTAPAGTFIPVPLKFVLQQISTFNLSKRIFEFTLKLGNSTYASFEELKVAITQLPAGTQITWDPGCDRIGGEPLHTHWKEFKALCEKQGIVLVVIPSG
ncbi:hypothetical protein [Rariglobus hedericola]|uniref:Uncharacterized protein n=1 Tax=Rariglobus hedericola TaxID=2597822 RepID=A0A556QMH6_9BACT|nr:hypothetical protein [Rariglobus hedericola]TSJ77825.1 hypothetical protein FPL22_00530 [Rariglobus hedericola]